MPPTHPSTHTHTLSPHAHAQVEGGCLVGVPLLVDGYAPDPGRLPDLLLALGRDVEWSREKECFHGVAQVCAAGA